MKLTNGLCNLLPLIALVVFLVLIAPHVGLSFDIGWLIGILGF